MKNIMCKLATSVVFILQITNINLVNSAEHNFYAAQVCNNSDYDRDSLVNMESNNIMNEFNIINTNKINTDFDNENCLKLAEIEKDNHIIQTKDFISNYFQNIEKLSDKDKIEIDLSYKKYELNINSVNSVGENPLEPSKSIREAWINCHHGSYGASSNVGNNKKTCCDCLTNIFNKVKSCIISSNNNEYTPINNDDNKEDNINEANQNITYLDIYDKVDKIIEYDMKNFREEYKYNSNKKTCYDFFKNLFNKVTSYILPSNNNTLYGEVTSEVTLSSSEQDLQEDRIESIELISETKYFNPEQDLQEDRIESIELIGKTKYLNKESIDGNKSRED